MNEQTTILYITDNALDKRLAEACKRHLLIAAEGKRIISISQKPINFGENICIGDIGRSSLSIDRQLKAGLERTSTKFIAIAEHDCLYRAEHFNWVPPDDKYFYYNVNLWFLQYDAEGHPEHNGVFSYRRRHNLRLAQSQLIAGKDSMLEATLKKIAILSDPKVRAYWPVRSRLGEPGIYSPERIFELFSHSRILHKRNEAVEYARTYTAKTFKTKTPNVDIRHLGNLTGASRAIRRRYVLEPWGTMEDVLHA